jgi:hypothetical protein
MTTPSDPSTACALGVDGMKLREETWRAVTDAALRTKVATSSGVRLEFHASPETAHALLDLVIAERRCCGWASWTLASTRDATVVEASAGKLGVRVLHAMFQLRP